jgi:hypothetical protein
MDRIEIDRLPLDNSPLLTIFYQLYVAKSPIGVDKVSNFVGGFENAPL